MKSNQKFIVLSLIFILSLSCFSAARLRSDSSKTDPDLGSNQDTAKVLISHEMLDKQPSINLVSEITSIQDTIGKTLEAAGKDNKIMTIQKESKKNTNKSGAKKNAEEKAKVDSGTGSADESK
jgi:hypothetical protein